MTRQFNTMILAGACALGLAVCATATTYYVNDSDTSYDVYCTATGNHENNGLTPATPFDSLATLTNKVTLAAGDAIYIDTGVYDAATIKGVAGSSSAPIQLVGSTNGTIMRGLTLQGCSWWQGSQLRLTGRMNVTSCHNMLIFAIDIRYITSTSETPYGLNLQSSSDCAFEGCSIFAPTGVREWAVGTKDNSFSNCTLVAYRTGFQGWRAARFMSCILAAKTFDLSVLDPTSGQNCLLSNFSGWQTDLVSFEASYTNWSGVMGGDPGFLDLDNGDLHLVSPSGYYCEQRRSDGIVTGATWVVDSTLPYSPAIDAGGDDVGSEPEPNGGRRNLGAYGGTAQASKSRPAGERWLVPLSCNSGERVLGETELRWNAGGFGVSDQVNVQLSTDGGATWKTLATVPVGTRKYVWSVSAADSSPRCVWRVQSTDGQARGECGRIFSARNVEETHFVFYVNDGSLVGDRFCTAVGDDANDGLSVATPKRTIQSVLDSYALYAGDEIRIDAGTYDEVSPVSIGATDGGTAGHPVVLSGVGRDTVLARGNQSWNVIGLDTAKHIVISNLTVATGRAGIVLSNSFDVAIANVYSCSNQYGLLVASGTNVSISYSAMVGNKWGVSAENSAANVSICQSVLWDNSTYALRGASSVLSVSNSILGCHGAGARLFDATARTPSGDYNVLDITTFYGDPMTLAEFQATRPAESWGNCMMADPLFVDAANGDFHLKSKTGHCEVVGTNATWGVDAVHSPAIDFGAKDAEFANEPAPNGARVNVGMYGNTAEASKSLTNAWLQVLTFNDGGTLNAQAGAAIRWNAGNMPAGAKLTLWLSRDGGMTWEALATGIDAASEEYDYRKSDVENNSSLNAFIRLSLESDDTVASQNAAAFTFRDGAFSFYVNDNSLVGDVYCSAVGEDGEGRGLSPAAPLPSLASVLTRYDLAQGDVVYVDTGSYTANETARFKKIAVASGNVGGAVRILGSTNSLAGGTVLGDRFASRAAAVTIPSTVSNLVFQNITFTNYQTAVIISNAVGISFTNVQFRGSKVVGLSVGSMSEDIHVSRSVFVGPGRGIDLGADSQGTVVDHCVFWETSVGVTVGANAAAKVRNSIMAASALDAVLYSLAPNQELDSDYNGFHAHGNAAFAKLSNGTWTGDDLYAWQQQTGQDTHSIPGDPMMADPGAYDYHLMTERTLGRYLPNGQRTTDEASSPLLNAGESGENMGVWGGTPTASLAQDGKRLNAWSFCDAGAVTSGTVPLRWGASEAMAGETVRVDYSLDGGKTWTRIAGGIPATNGIVQWNTAGVSDTPAAMWRVVCESDESCASDNGIFFAVRNAPLTLYVATADTNETVYVTGPGKPDNWEATRANPLDSVKSAFDHYDLAAGDTILVDRGIYPEDATLTVGYRQSGAPEAPVVVRGLTNEPYGAATMVLNARRSGSQLMSLNGVKNIRFESIGFSNAWSGVRVSSATGIVFKSTWMAYFVTNALYAAQGADVRLDNSVVADTSVAGVVAYTGSVVRLNHAFVRDSVRQGLALMGGTLSVSNSILEARGQGRDIFHWFSPSTKLYSDYNCIRAFEGASVARYAGGKTDRFLYDWQVSRGGNNDMRSFGYEPMMAAPDDGDFHLASVAGRYDPAKQMWVEDEESSKLIDMGVGDYAAEPVPNGGRANVGPYGNTGEASKSVGTAQIIPLTMSDGGTMRGDVTLYWTWNGIAGTTRVNVLFSGDGGVTFTNVIAENIYLNQGADGISWSTTNVASTAMGVWRVETMDGQVAGQTETLFAIKNAALTYYVNDGSTAGDVYCTAAGSAANDGLTPSTPINSLDRLLGLYKLDVGDIVYVDTGVYGKSGSLTIAPGIMASTNKLVIQGSTNMAAGGTVLSNSADGAVLTLSGATALDLRDMTLKGGQYGMLVQHSSSNRFWHILSDGARENAFDMTSDSADNLFDECAAVEFGLTGLVSRVKMDPRQAPVTNTWNGGVMISKGMNSTNASLPVTTSIFVAATSGRMNVSNSVFQANASKDVIFSMTAGTLASDYNAFERVHPKAKLAVWRDEETVVYGIQSRAFDNLAAWRTDTDLDRHSYAGALGMADIAKRDFHPLSPAGRYDVATGTMVTNDSALSPLVGIGSDGQNLGWYATGDQASLAGDALACAFLSFNDGGLAEGQVQLTWARQGGSAQTVVDVFASSDGGSTYQKVGSAAASEGTVDWDSSTYPASASGRWQIRASGTVVATSDKDFVIHSGPISYYVNDDSTAGDLYCTAKGDDANTGYAPNKPKATLAALLDSCTLGAGDIVHVDAGQYELDDVLEINYCDHGSRESPVCIKGVPHDKTILRGRSSVSLDNTYGVRLDSMVVRSSRDHGLSLSRAEDVFLDGMAVLESGKNALNVSICSNVFGSHLLLSHAVTNGLFAEASYGVYIDQSVIASNAVGAVRADAQLRGGTSNTNRLNAFVSVSNSILTVRGDRTPIYSGTAHIYGNYNDLYATDGGLVGLRSDSTISREFGSVNAWYNDCGQEFASLSHDPLFADARQNDFHLRSAAGRWTKDGFVQDEATSPLLDAGDPDKDVGEEMAPNGNRVNLGRYGGTAEASMTPTEGSLVLISLNDGGKAGGAEFPVAWLAQGSTTNSTITIEYSSDEGVTWQILATDIPASQSVWYWDTTVLPPSVQGSLRLTSSDGSQVQNATCFSIRNEGDTFAFYINDSSTANDEYCTAAGDNNQDGLTPATPMADLNALLARYDLDAGDMVYVDVGVYRSGATPWRISQVDTAGDLISKPVVIQGPTNSIFGGAVLDRQGNPSGMQISYGIGLEVRNICVSNVTGGAAFSVQEGYGVRLDWLAVANVSGTGIQISQGSDIVVSRAVVNGANIGVNVETPIATNAVDAVVEHCVFQNIGSSVLKVSGRRGVNVEHNVYMPDPGAYVYDVAATARLSSDYNAFVLQDGARVSRRTYSIEESLVPDVFDTVGAWATSSGSDGHSYEGDPLFANAATFDFHLKSTAGRYDAATHAWVRDAEDSPLLDAGRPDAGVGDEPEPNGGRRNIGLYGGTSQASKSSSDGHFVLLSYNNGGTASGRVCLSWHALGAATGATVRVEVSADNGQTWADVGRGIDAASGEILWNSGSFTSGPLYRWRIIDEGGTFDTVESIAPFIVHNTGIAYYVNDDFVDANGYCTAIGRSSNDGVTPATPKRWIQEIVDTYHLNPGDVVYVDGGSYQTEASLVIGDLDSGRPSRAAGEYVRIQGQTNLLANKTVLINPGEEGNIMTFDAACGIRVCDIQMLGSSNAIRVGNGFYVDFDGVEVANARVGLLTTASSNLLVSHSSFVGMKEAAVEFSSVQHESMSINNSVLWSNRYGVHLHSGCVCVSNSVISALGDQDFAYYVHLDHIDHFIRSDYNAIYVGNGMAAGLQRGNLSSARTTLYSRVSAWAAEEGQDTHSLAQDPLFADAAHGDFHLKSVSGCWNGSSWVYSDRSSPLIDAGAPSSRDWLNEPDPNGRRLNIGMYGGTWQASKSPEAGWLTPLTLVDGGAAAGEVLLTWQVGGAATNDMVCIEYSPDRGVTWQTICQGWPADTEAYLWNSAPFGSSALGMWRLYSQRDQSIMGETMRPFILRNGGTIPYYVNDTLDDGDVYCTAAGNDRNDGLTPATPKATLQAILDAYELGDADVVYVDAGRYSAGSPPIAIDGQDSGHDDLYVVIQGSTNPAAQTVFRAANSDECIFNLAYAENVRLKNLVLENAQTGIQMTMCINCELEDMRIQRNRAVGVSMERSSGTKFNRSLFWKNASTTGGVAVAIGLNSDVTILNSVLWGSWTAVRSVQGGDVNVTNSVLQACEANGRVYTYTFQTLMADHIHADYNVYSRVNGAILAEQAYQSGGSDLYDDLAKWSVGVHGDRHSFAMAPGFVDADGTGDFHLLSPAGYYSTNDCSHRHYSSTQSPLIDAGDPSMDVGAEPEANGGRINIGIYGGTPYASITPIAQPWIRALSYNEECVVTTNMLLYWNYGGIDDAAKVTLQYTVDYGVNWRDIVTDLPISAREYEWNVASLPLTIALKWRIKCETGHQDESDVYVSVKTQCYDYYINDDSTEGDIYCREVGSEWDNREGIGQRPDCPLLSLVDLFEHYPVGAGDRVFIDTGTYDLGTNVVTIGNANSGFAGMPLLFVGSTNWLKGGSVIRGLPTKDGLSMLNTRFVVMSNLCLRGMRNGMALKNVSDVVLAGMDIRGNEEVGVSAINVADFSLENSVVADNGLGGVDFSASQTGFRAIRQSTLVNNGQSAVETDRAVEIYNSIIVQTNEDAVGVNLPLMTSEMTGDYNLYWTAGPLATNAFSRSSITSVRQWQDETGETHSFSTDPLFTDMAAGDYHLQSRAGCWSNGTWVRAAATSWAIDAGDPASMAYVREPTPNGARLNLGAYGGTAQASLTDTTRNELFTLSLNDGGVAPAGQMLYWLWRGLTGTEAVRLMYSPDDGETWRQIAQTTVGAGTAGFEWRNDWDPSPLSRWQLVLVADTNVNAMTESTFVFRPRPIVYYVNDYSQEGDMYTTAVGDEHNNGYQPGSPLDSLVSLLERYQLTSEDMVLVDAGSYEFDRPLAIAGLHSGKTDAPSMIVGSTNSVAPSVFVPAEGMTNAAIGFNAVHDFEVRNLTLVGFQEGATIPQGCARITLADLEFFGTEASAVAVRQGRDVQLNRVLARSGHGNGMTFETASRVFLDGCVLWGNASNGLVSFSSSVYVTNSVISASGFGNYCYVVSTGEVMRADYNDLYLEDSAQVAQVVEKQYERLPQWVCEVGMDRHSLSTDPAFHDPDNGDFHLRSIYGRFDPLIGEWVNDVSEGGLPDVSPLIDTGCPSNSYAFEPMPNGGRRNIGLYGDTWQASKSDTNAWLLAVTAMSGGLVQGTFYLTWGYGGDIDSNDWVRLEYSPYNGEGEWYYIATNRVGAESYYWVSDQKDRMGNEQWTTSPEAQWRVVLIGNTNVWDATSAFGLRNRPFTYYVNDLSTDGDLYTTAPGSDLNSGFWPRVPKYSLQSLLNDVDLEPTDEIYMDTGDYYMEDTNSPVSWQVSDGGTKGMPVRLIGSTNGTTFIVSNVFSTGYVFDLNTEHAEVRDIAFANRIAGNRGMLVQMSGNGLDVARLTTDRATLNLNSRNSTYSDINVQQGSVTLAGTSNLLTRMETIGGTVNISGSDAMLENSVIFVTNLNATAVTVRASSSSMSNTTVVARNGTALGKAGTGLLTLVDNILVAGGQGAVINWANGSLNSDYNDLYAMGPKAWIGIVDGAKWERLKYWQDASGVDKHSVSFDPKFADENGDFHLLSMAVSGRYDRRNNRWRTDSEHSPAIDLGHPLLGTASEPMPNGYRRNLGAYGGTAEASRSITNFWVQALSLNDGGVVKGTNVVLRWAANIMPEWQPMTVRLEYSTDGSTWQTIASGLSAPAGEYVWDTTGFADSFTAYWRVVSEADNRISDQTDTAFNLRNSATDFYVSPSGNDANDGLAANRPMRNIQALLNRYDLEAGDTVHVAAGSYANDKNLEVIWSRSGSAEEGDVLIDGAEGVELSAGTPGITIHASHFHWNGARMDATSLTNDAVGVVVDSGTGVTLSGFDFQGQGTAVKVDSAHDTAVRNSSFWQTATGISLMASRSNVLENLTFVDMPVGIRLVQSDGNVLRNNIFIPSADGYAYEIGTAVNLLSDGFVDYNIYDLGAEASGIYQGATNDLRRWQLAMDNDYRSLIGAADLYNPARGDFHPRSEYGRWNGTAFVNDSLTSFAVDHGDPAMDVGDEVAPNGDRINIGRFGGTARASKGGTDVGFGIRTLDEPGLRISSADATWPLVWDTHLVDQDAMVYVQFSGNGVDWETLTTTNAYAEYYVWTLSNEQQTDAGRWRVITEDGTIMAQSSNTFQYVLAKFGFLTPPYRQHGLMRFKWQGGLAGKRYVIKYSDDYGQTWQLWPAEYNGPEKINRSNFVMQPGETALEYIFEDVTSFGKTQRWYRMYQLDE